VKQPVWKTLLYLLPALLLTRPACSDVMISSVDKEGARSTVLIAGEHARINHAHNETYLLLDLKKKQVYAVNTREAFVMDLSTPHVKHGHGEIRLGKQMPRVQLIRQGNGPVISGYATQGYRVSVQEKYCHEEYLATEPLANREIQHFLQVMSALSDSREEIQRNLLFDDSDPCDIAADTIDDQYQKLGLPMKTVLSDGSLNRLITHIDTATTIPPGTFALPANYPILSRQEVWQQHEVRLTAEKREKLLQKNHAIQQRIETMEKQRAIERTPVPRP